MTMQIVSLIQGSPAWHKHRAQHFNASDAPAMMGCSPYKTRDELIKELATGVTAEVDAATQRIFDAGHQFEALARPLGEKIAGDDFSPCVGTSGKYSASFDGLSFIGDTAFEHKSLNAALREAMIEGCTGADLPLVYQVQMEQQAMVSGCERILFMASKWKASPDTGEMVLVEQRHCWYTPNLELRARIVAGWEELEADVAAYVPGEQRTAPAVAAPVDSLPAVAVQLQGALEVVSNLPAFGEALRTFIDRIPSKPATDQEFADTEAACKALKKAEDMLEATEASALAQISDVEVLRRTVASLRNLARTTRLAKEKLVTAEKEARRTQIVTGAQTALDQHVQTLNQRLRANWIPRVNGGFGEVIKGKKSLANMEDAVAVALTDAKHDANVLAKRLEANRAHLVQEDGDWVALFADFAAVGTKAAEDFEALAALRIGNHKQAEAKRLEAEREKIRAEEAERANRIAREETALTESIWADARRIEADRVPYIRKAMAQFESGAGQFENDPRSRVREAIANARAEMNEKLAAAEQRDAKEREAAEAAELERQRIQRQAQEDTAEIVQAHQVGTLAEPVASDLAELVADKAIEEVAGIDAQQAINSAKSGPPAADNDEVATMTLGQINTLIAPLKVDAAGLADLGFTPSATVKAAKHFPASDVPKILAAMVRHLQGLMVAA